MGGWGATGERDGFDAMYSANNSDTSNCPVEACTMAYRKNEAAGCLENSGLFTLQGMAKKYPNLGRPSLKVGIANKQFWLASRYARSPARKY